MWDWFIVSVLLPVTEFSWNELVHTLKVEKFAQITSDFSKMF